METKEFKFKGTVLNGFAMLFVVLALFFASVVGIIFGIIRLDETDGACGGWLANIRELSEKLAFIGSILSMAPRR